MLISSDEERRLLEAVVTSPDDDGPRLVLSDALQARGEPFGEYIALEIKVSQAKVNWETWAWNLAGGARGLRETPLHALLDDVLAGTRSANGVDLEIIAHRKRLLELEGQRSQWAAELVPGATEVHWQRGFPTGVTVTARALLDHTERPRSPVSSLLVTDAELFDPALILSLPWASTVRALELQGGTGMGAGSEVKSAGPTQLRQLILTHQVLRVGVLERSAAGLEHLERLRLPATVWGDGDFEALLNAPALRELTVDSLQGEVPISLRWRELLTRPQLQVHFEATKITGERFDTYAAEHATWGSLGAFLRSREPPGGTPTRGPRWGRYRFW